MNELDKCSANSIYYKLYKTFWLTCIHRCWSRQPNPNRTGTGNSLHGNRRHRRTRACSDCCQTSPKPRGIDRDRYRRGHSSSRLQEVDKRIAMELMQHTDNIDDICHNSVISNTETKTIFPSTSQLHIQLISVFSSSHGLVYELHDLPFWQWSPEKPGIQLQLDGPLQVPKLRHWCTPSVQICRSHRPLSTCVT